MDYAERSYHRALKQLLQIQSGLPAPPRAEASAPGPPPSVLELPPAPAEFEPSQAQPPIPGIGFVPAIRPAALGRVPSPNGSPEFRATIDGPHGSFGEHSGVFA
jgi:hypothetical protein